MSTTLIISIYAAVISTFNLVWRIFEFYFDKKPRIKITCEFYPNFIIGPNQFTAIYQFTIVNISTKKRVINTIGHEYNTIKGVNHASFSQMPKRPVPLEFGESLKYDVDYTDFDNTIEKSKVSKIRLIVTDSIGKEYKSKWIKVERHQPGSYKHNRKR
jgi:hypothetical protein